MWTLPSIPRFGFLGNLPRRIRRIAIAVVILLALIGAVLASFTLEPMRAAIWQQRSKLCGSIVAVNEHPPEQVIGSATVWQAEDCFMIGYTHCQIVSLKYTTGGVDSFTTDTFVVEPAFGPLAGCGLANAWSGWVSTRTSSGTSRCTDAVREADGLHMQGCGGEDILIPSS